MKTRIKTFFLLYFLFHLSACGVGSISTDPDLGVSDVEVEETVTNGSTAVITLSWIPPTTYTDNQLMYDLSHYKIYFGSSSPKIEPLIPLMEVDSNLTSIVIENDPRFIKGNTYYFGMTAFNSNNIESPMSEIVKLESAQ